MKQLLVLVLLFNFAFACEVYKPKPSPVKKPWDKYVQYNHKGVIYA